MSARKHRIPVVVDTNVFVRSFKTRSKSSPNRRVIRLWLIERKLQLPRHDGPLSGQAAELRRYDMKVAYQLRPLPAAHPAVAVLVPGRQAGDVLGFCAALGLDPLPVIHRVADGFLVKLPRSLDNPLAGVIRLRALSADLLLPVGADLIPALLPDEATALVRQRGLVFLPGDRVLEFDPDAVVPLADMLDVGTLEQPAWQALPEPPPLADELSEIALELPDLLPDDLLQAGGPGMGSDSSAPSDTGLPSNRDGKRLFRLGLIGAIAAACLAATLFAGGGGTAVGGGLFVVLVLLAIAGALFWLFYKRHSGREPLVRRLSEKLLGQQEAMLRRLLRQFRAGDIEEALRRALPIGGAAPRGSTPAQNARLPRHNLFYSLLNLLGGRGESGAAIWYGGGSNTYRELAQEYRKQAEQAAARGDFRRAAFIYGKLLRDFGSAAQVLARGGLHRDAAILYERALNDLPAAAGAWAIAGEIDRAVAMYVKLGDHAAAGDLLRRAGEEERAIAEYQVAAAKLVESGQRHYEAGQLLEGRGQRPDLALPYYQRGWRARPHGSPLPCALRLAQHHAAGGAAAALLALTGEADEFLEACGAESAGLFYNALARHADEPVLAPVADELRDRARLGLARKLVQAAERPGGNSFATLFPAGSPWAAPLVGDAAHALAEARRRAPVRAAPVRRAPAGTLWSHRRIRQSTVRAVHQMPVSKEVFLGLESGEVLCYRPNTGAVATIAQEKGPILSLGACAADEYLVMLSQADPQRVCLTILAPASDFRMLHYQHVAVEGSAWLCKAFENQPSHLIGIYAGRMVGLYRCPDLTPHGTWYRLAEEDAATALLGAAPALPHTPSVLALYPSRAEWHYDERAPPWTTALPWTPSDGLGVLTHPLVHATWNDDGLVEIIGLDAHGALRLSRIHPFTAATPKTLSAWPGDDEPFVAFARLRAGLMAGVTRTKVHWLRWGNTKPAAPPTPLRTGDPVAAFALPATDELLIVEADCSLTRMAVWG